MSADELTRRERQVLELTRAGLSAPEIAGRLGFSRLNTVYAYRCRIMDKLGVAVQVRRTRRLVILSTTLLDSTRKT